MNRLITDYRPPMDSFFGIGAPELILILLLASIVMGPQRIGKAARWMGKTTARLQTMSRHFMRQLNAELAAADEGGDLKGAMDDIQALRRQVSDLRQELKSSTLRPVEEGKTAVQETQEMVKKAVDLSTDPDSDDGDGATIAAESPNRIAPLPKLPNLIEVADDPE
ncbi:MAG: hypothetical protein GY803_16365 [Chloroflexi bacterium]|nr:hypothetical protein [Chloroflexota bacterium]